jgi:hypothetical protein
VVLDHGALMRACRQSLLWQQGHGFDTWHATTTLFHMDPQSRTCLSPNYRITRHLGDCSRQIIHYDLK